MMRTHTISAPLVDSFVYVLREGEREREERDRQRQRETEREIKDSGGLLDMILIFERAHGGPSDIPWRDDDGDHGFGFGTLWVFLRATRAKRRDRGP